MVAVRMHSAYHILTTLWRDKVDLCLPIWLSMTVSAAFVTLLLVDRPPTPVPRSPRSNPIELKREEMGWRRSHLLVILLFSAFVACYIALTIKWEDFAYYGNNQFTCVTLRGSNYPPPIWVASGRFEPLTLQEFNVIRHLSTSISAYHAVPIFQLAIVSIILLSLDVDVKCPARALLGACVLIETAVVVSFTGLIYPDRNLLFWLLCLIFAVKRFEQTHSSGMAVAAIVSAQFMLYYKETAFVLLWGFVAGRLLLRCRNADGSGCNLARLREKASRLDLCLAFLGLIFLLYYGAVMFRHTHLGYVQAARRPELEVLFWYLKTDLLAFLLPIVVMSRTYRIYRRRIASSPFWEGLAYGGLAYFLALCCLSMYSDYYMAPVDVIAVLYLGRLVCLSWRECRLGAKAALAGAICCVLIQNVLVSTIADYYRKNLIHSKSEIASVIHERYQSGRGSTQRLFFPFASRDVTMEFGAYLSYRGLPIEGVQDRPALANKVLLVSPAMTKDGPLVDFRSIIGRAGHKPERGDLVIVLPDDDASLSQSGSFLHGGSTIFSYVPCPHLPRWLSLLGRRLYVPSPVLGEPQKLSDHWLRASVTVWKGAQ